ncbi:aminotransferase class I/II-fold pyridoxal phosphate-dependent enzyme [Tenacibaculum ovolyticum]|uniref:aminotransferase class I/II-fold pyridoxal phosphate-dependent enzyme n=1 Tax=Tenacibaculum ovolyticum TaxID=104270 RepID=UPI001EEE7616|nr:aminotransferase class I/II-fold pyridoxal phosphate-dependent enzyme [Tenacibaculum ovolyticum]
MSNINNSKILSPKRNSTVCTTVEELATEQLAYFDIDANSAYGETLKKAAIDIYTAQADISKLQEITFDTVGKLDASEKVAYFNAKRFMSFQIAKVLETLQGPLKKTYESLEQSDATLNAKGPMPLFNNIAALFSATPVIARTSTYDYSCTEWIDDAFNGKESIHHIYSRSLNPTSMALGTHMVHLEAGKYADEYTAWNFNSGMAAIDALLCNVLSYQDIIIVSRNIYGGAYQLIEDFFAKKSKMDIQVVWFDGYTLEDFKPVMDQAKIAYKEQIAGGKKIHVYIESPCNPHGYMLDVPAICKYAKQNGSMVMLDGTVATPFLIKPLQQEDEDCRPDFLFHSYTKDITGSGNAIAGGIIGKNSLMFVPKGEKIDGVNWDESLFWNVYYIKGAFLNADTAFEILSGMKTMNLRMTQKCVNTLVMAKFFNSNPEMSVICNAVESDPNNAIMKKVSKYKLAAPLFTIDFEKANVSDNAFKKFFDTLAPAFGFQVSLGQINTTLLCPAFTSHSELDKEALLKAGIHKTTMRISVGNENPKELIKHFIQSIKLMIDPEKPGFSDAFMTISEIDTLYADTYMEVQKQLIENGYLN